jgi:hypothetical protein
MGIIDTFSKRKKRIQSAGKQDAYQYADLPQPFRIQVFHIWRDALGRYYVPRGYSHGNALASNIFWETIHNIVSREAGLPYLGDPDQDLRAALESGVPTIRNTSSGHGQGPVPVELPEHFAAHALHLLAANVVFLIEAEKALK